MSRHLQKDTHTQKNRPKEVEKRKSYDEDIQLKKKTCVLLIVYKCVELFFIKYSIDVVS